MPSIQDIRSKGRGDIHAHASVPVIYLTSAGADPLSPLPKVRVHTVFHDAEAGPGAQMGLASMFDTVPKIRFLRSEVSKPIRGGIVLLSATEGYRVHGVRPAYGLTIDAEVQTLDEDDMETHWDASYQDLIDEAQS